MIEVIIMFRVYFFVVGFLILNTIARLVFGEVRMKLAVITLVATFFWPLFLFSKRGRKRLLGKINKL